MDELEEEAERQRREAGEARLGQEEARRGVEEATGQLTAKAGKWGTWGWGVTEGKGETGDQSKVAVVKGVKGDDDEMGVWRRRAGEAESRLQEIAEERETERAAVERKVGAIAVELAKMDELEEEVERQRREAEEARLGQEEARRGVEEATGQLTAKAGKWGRQRSIMRE